MESDVLDTITIKQLLNNSIINNENFDYIKQMINKNARVHLNGHFAIGTSITFLRII